MLPFAAFSSFLRGMHYNDKVLGKWLHLQHRKALARTLGGFRLGASPGEYILHPGVASGGLPRKVWTPPGALRAGKGHNSSQVPVQRSQKGGTSLSAAQKVKEAGKDFTYLIVVVVGIGVTGGLFYVIFKELFSSSSPSKIYGDALEKCRAHPEVIGVFGEPIKGYGEATRRGRRQLVSHQKTVTLSLVESIHCPSLGAITWSFASPFTRHQNGSVWTSQSHIEYEKDGLKYMRLKFYIEGSEKGKQGTVHLEVKENPENGKYEYRYIFVDIDVYPRRTIIIEDNRYLNA